MNQKNNTLNNETLLPQRISTLIRDSDLYNKEILNYFKKDYRKRLKDCGKISIAILLSLISLILIIVGFSIDILLKNLNSLYLFVFSTFIIPLCVIGVLFFLMTKQFGINEFNISTLQDNKEFEYNNFMNETLISDINGTFFLTI